VLAFDVDTRLANDTIFGHVDFGGRQVFRTGDPAWRVSDTADSGWTGLDLHADESRIADFERRQPFVGIGAIEPGDFVWGTAGNAWGLRPDSVGSAGTAIGHVEGRYFSTSFDGFDAVGSLYSPPFTLDRSYLHFLLGGGAYPNGHATGCTCARLWSLNGDGERGELLETWTGGNNGTLSWQNYMVPEAYQNTQVQLEFADESAAHNGYLAVDDVYLSNNSRPHGLWVLPSVGLPMGNYARNEEWPLFDLRLGSRVITPGAADRRYYRMEFELTDSDGDGVIDGRDLCPQDPGAAHTDANWNGVGDACDPCPECENIARGRPTAASSTLNNNYATNKIVDGSSMGLRGLIDFWVPAARRAAWIEVDLQGSKDVCVIRWKNINNQAFWSWSTGSWRLSVFDGEEEHTVDEGAETEYPILRWHTTVLDECIQGDRVRIYADTWNRDGGGVSELEVYGDDLAQP
jgi:hypothetical protein